MNKLDIIEDDIFFEEKDQDSFVDDDSIKDDKDIHYVDNIDKTMMTSIFDIDKSEVD